MHVGHLEPKCADACISSYEFMIVPGCHGAERFRGPVSGMDETKVSSVKYTPFIVSLIKSTPHAFWKTFCN